MKKWWLVMADMGTLSDQYRRSAHIAAKVNDALIPVKRFSLLRRVRDEKQLKDAQSTLAQIARSFAEVVEADTSNLESLDWPDDLPPSHAVLDAVRDAAASERAYVVDDLRAAADCLAKGEALNDELLAVLELVADAASNEAAEAYRRLMRI